VKRLVEGVEVRVHQRRPVFSVRFMSKTMALALATRYTLTQEHHIALHPQLPWDLIVDAAHDGAEDLIEGIIASAGGDGTTSE
jgi:hypothetical protein